MASYNVALYCNSGFNSINIPDNPDTLASSATIITVPAINILQDKFLSAIDIRVNWETVEKCDYVKVGSFFYSVSGTHMFNQETARLFLTPDFITSAGGIKKSSGSITAGFDILDGITDRQTVDSDEFGEYSDADPLTAPQQPLQIITEWKNPAPNNNPYVLVKTTLDLYKMANQKEGKTYTDAETGEDVTVPMTYQTDSITQIQLPDADHTVGDGTRYYAKFEGGFLPTLDTQDIKDGISAANGLGVEGAILDQWQVPGDYLTITKAEDATDGQNLTQVSGKSGTLTTSLVAEYATVKNKRCLYGEYNKYGIITASGNSMEAKPEEITNGDNPEISWKSDPRPEGKPYFRFATMNGNTEFWRNAIAGEVWEQVPLVYQGRSGSQLTRLNFDNSRRSQELARQQYSDRNALTQLQNAGTIALGTATMLGGGLALNPQTVAGGASQVLGGINGIMSTEQARQQYMATYKLDKANELSRLYQDTTVYTPTVNFPYNASIIRDIKGNGILVYRYEYTPADLRRIDTLLTMYGYKEAEPLTITNFFRRQKFDYVQCSAVSITGLPRWWNDGIADQLRNGVRIWHVKPDASAYSDNPIGG